MRAGRYLLTLALILTLAAFAAACGGDDDDGGSSGDFSNEVVRERDGISLAIASDKASYAEGEDVVVRATLTNGASGPITYGSSAAPNVSEAISISINTVLAGQQELPPTEDSPAETGGTLEQEHAFSSDADWDRMLATYQTPVDAPAGTYTATAVVIVKLPEATEAAELTAAVEFTLETGATVALPEVVIQSAVAQQEVKDWFEGRNLNVICAYGGRLIFYNVDVTTGAMAETFESLYDVALQEGDPICNPVTEGDMWRVIFTDVTGDPPNKVSAMLELETADFIRLEEGGPTAAPPPAATPSQ